MKNLTLTQMDIGQKGRVIEVIGGHNATRRLGVLGIRPGKDITKVAAHFWRGPVTVKVNNSVIAVGFGMASKVLVEVTE